MRRQVPVTDARERLERILGGQHGISLDEELNRLDETGEEQGTAPGTRLRQLLDLARQSTSDAFDLRAIDQLQDMWNSPPYVNSPERAQNLRELQENMRRMGIPDEPPMRFVPDREGRQ